MQFCLSCIGCFLVVLLAACSSALPAQAPLEPGLASPVSSTVVPSPGEAGIISPRTPSPRPPTPQIGTPTSLATSRPTPASLALCSPLAAHPLEDLPSILSNPFQAPRPGRDDGHHGSDFAYYQYGDRTTLEGVVVQPLLEGVVVAAIPDRIPYGNMVMVASDPDRLPPAVRSLLGVESGQSLYTLYAHLAEPAAVASGTHVSCGQPLGIVGNTGWSGNPHLHLETRLGPAGRLFESMAYYDTRASQVERENYEAWRMSGEFALLDPMILIETYLEGNW